MNTVKPWAGKSAAVLLVSALALAACSKEEKPSAASVSPAASPSGAAASPGTSAKPSAAAAQDYTLPIVKDGSVQLSFAMNDNYYAPKSFTQSLPVWDEIEKRTGVRIKWDVTPQAQYAQVMKVRLAAAKDLPDIFTIPEPNPIRLANEGLIIPLDDLIAKYAPNIRKLLADFPELRRAMQSADGKIYALSNVVTGIAENEPYGLMVRQDWLKKLNLQEPRTLDDWYNVLKAFKEKDPNGNGKPDEIPLSPQNGIGGVGIFGSALGLHLLYSEGYYPDANGKVQYQWMDEKAHQLIVWLNKLYKDGLINPQFMRPDAEGFAKINARNLVGTTDYFFGNQPTFNAALKEAGVADPDWQSTLPPAGDGQKGFYEMVGPTSGWYGISKDSKNPEVAIKWLDYIYASEEGNRLVALGIEGKSYSIVNGQPEFTEWALKNPDGLTFANALRSLGAIPPTLWARTGSGPLSISPKLTQKLSPELFRQSERTKPFMVPSFSYMSTLPSASEAEETAQLLADINTYRDETLLKFITGQTPIDWNKFTSTLKSMGIDKVLKNKQNQYDRAQK
ncbi:extracellular solute-binding protein [Paenibacillus cymbidii]|uniref:extracellular solute-binding protein n=1 Tax=Paenibacillus cymbidii TaxID=1639034 RepID=UPI001436827B|nr:extracellular solute-binding protein [Paenibacillus cymbidii]